MNKYKVIKIMLKWKICKKYFKQLRRTIVKIKKFFNVKSSQIVLCPIHVNHQYRNPALLIPIVIWKYIIYADDIIKWI